MIDHRIVGQRDRPDAKRFAPLCRDEGNRARKIVHVGETVAYEQDVISALGQWVEWIAGIQAGEQSGEQRDRKN
ncbi:MAG: hypothetical protein M3Q09_04755 [Gemmatimonadota bacterium]|nr:hypothetical protein [Gemmatimonadota bacterium]